MDHLDGRIVWSLFRERMSHQKDGHATNLAQRLPPLFAALDPILNGQVQRVEEHTSRNFKAEPAMLALIAEVLVLVALRATEPILMESGSII